MIDLEQALQLLNDAEKTQRAFYKHGNQSNFDRYRLLKDVALLVYESSVLPQDLQYRIAYLRENHSIVKFDDNNGAQIAKLVLAAVYIEHLTVRGYLAVSYRFDNSVMETELKQLFSGISADFLQLEKDCLETQLSQVVANYGSKEQQVFDLKLTFNKLIVLLVAVMLEGHSIWKMIANIEQMALELGREGDVLLLYLRRVRYLVGLRYLVDSIKQQKTKEDKLGSVCYMLGVGIDLQYAEEFVTVLSELVK